jgi:transcriptional regulator with XRE-family HTH domain
MPRVTGPTIARWRLGKELKQLREAAGCSYLDAAHRLDCSESKIRKIEASEVGVVRAELDSLLELYKLEDDDLRYLLHELQRLGKQRGWWAPLGSMPKQYAFFLSLESDARRVRTFEPMMVPGLLQTEEYAHALDAMCTFESPEELERSVQIRMARQEAFWKGRTDPSRLWVIVDEAALRRPAGKKAGVMRGQLMRLLELSDQCIFQIVPFEVGSYPGTIGPFTICEFDENVHSPVVYTDGQAGIAYLEKPEDVDRAGRAFNHMAAMALSPAQSGKKILAILSEMAKQQGGEYEG